MTIKKRILLVNDPKDSNQTLSMVLETRGYQVNTATSGEEAIAKAVTHPDMILMDMDLPDSKGIEVCRRLREEKGSKDIPIIIFSDQYLYEDKIESLYSGADDYLTKPLEIEELLARMEAILRRCVLFDFQQEDYRSKVIAELRTIIKSAQIRTLFQPIFYLQPFRLLGFEALSRPYGGSLLSNPEKLFKAALTYGMYCDLEALAWDKALANRPPYLSKGKLFLNCSPYFVESPMFFKVKSLFEQHNISPKDVVLEITERSAITDFNGFYERLRGYKEFGFSLAVDDVGGGYASLESIVQVKPNIVKIDNHLVENIHQDPIKRSIIKFMTTFCRENQMITIAEGVEKKEELAVILALGVDAAQGYLLCRPTERPNLSDIYKDIQARINDEKFALVPSDYSQNS